MPKISILFAALSVFPVTSAHAHVGHVADLAGHSHWVALGAAVAAAAIAALVVKSRRGKDEKATEDDQDEVSDGEAETA
ncbi:MAG: DUF6732 family protein [Pseudomonadota bacterium]